MSETKKQGRPTIGDTAMTPAERVKKTREARKAAGIKQYNVLCSIKDIDKIAAHLGCAPSAAVARIMEHGVREFLNEVEG